MVQKEPSSIFAFVKFGCVKSLLLLLSGSMLGAMTPQGPPPFTGGPEQGGPPASHGNPGHRGPMDRSMHVGPPGRWWNDPFMVQRIGLTPAQQRKMNQVFDESRLHLIDLSAAVQKQEAILDPMLASDPVDDTKVLAQIDRAVEARAALERANSAMLLGLRKALTAEQWQRLQTDDPRNR